MFELITNNDFLRIEPLKQMYPNSETDWDRNIILSKITIKAGGFQGEYNASLMIADFENLRKELSKLYDNLDGYTDFYCIDEYISLYIKGDGIGHFSINCTAIDEPGVNQNELKFNLYFDQTQISDLLTQLDLILKEYTILGKLNIKNK
jgi:hypothetical protein